MNLTQKSSERLSLVYRNWPGLFFILDTDLKIITGSKEAITSLTFSQDEILHKSISHIYASGDKEEAVDDLKWRLSLEYISHTGETHKMNVRKLMVRDKDGAETVKNFRPVNVPIYDENNELRYILHQLEEVHPEDQSGSNGIDFDIISIINDGIYEIDFKSKQVRWNDQLYTILGYTIGEIDLDLAKMLRTIHKEDRRRVRDLIKSKKRYAPGFEIEFRLKKKTGEFIDVLSKGIITRNKFGDSLKLTATIHDVSNYKNQERLKAQLELITDTLPAMVCYIDNDLKYQFLNSAYEKMFDKPIDEIVGSYVGDVLSHDEYKTFLPKALKALQGEKVEVEHITKVGGRSRNIKTWYVPDKANNNVSGFIGLTMDVTEERNREIELKKTTAERQELLEQLRRAHHKISKEKNLLKDFFMEAPALIAIHEGPDYVIKYLNKNAAHLYGDWVGEPFKNITSKVVYKKIKKIFDSVYKEQKEYTVKEFKLMSSLAHGMDSKRKIFFDLVVQPILDVDGNSMGIILYANDVTDLVKAKRATEAYAERNRLLLEAMPAIACTYEPQGKIEYVNSKWYEYTGQDPGGSLEEGIKSALHPQDLIKNDVVWSSCLVNKCMYDEYLRIKDRFGNYKWHHHRVVPIIDDQNMVVRWIGTATDVDEEVKANEKKDEFIGIASHELKTPLTSVKAYIQLVQEKFAEVQHVQSESINTYLRKAYKNTERLNVLITELLDVSRIQSGKMDLKIQPFNLDDMVKEVIESNQYTTTTHQIKMSGSTDLVINGDKERLEQILNNLLSNAIKYSPGRNEVIINLCKTDNHVLINVKDFGIGISKNEQRKLFEQFYRAKNVSKGAGGLGLGLYISLAIAKKHGGHITIRSEEGKGSTFTLILPR